jgi:hypothetical protein
MGKYLRIAGFASAVAAALRRFLQLSSKGELPIVNPEIQQKIRDTLPCVDEIKPWKVYRVGRSMT